MVSWVAFLIAFTVGFFINEIVAVAQRRPTLSVQIRTWSRAFPPLPFILTFGAGMLAGHLFWHWCDCG